MPAADMCPPLKSLVGSLVSYLSSCPEFVNKNRRGECFGTHSLRGQRASLYSSYAADVLSDLMSKKTVSFSNSANPPPPLPSMMLTITVMILQLRLVWNLQMARGQKIGVIVLFSTGFVCVGFATLRCIQISMTLGTMTGLVPAWIALWTVVEGAIVIVVGCCPAFAILFHAHRASHRSYDTNGYWRHDQSRLASTRRNPDMIVMNPVAVGAGRAHMMKGIAGRDDNSSREELAAHSKGIMVTTTVEQDHHESNVENNRLGKWPRNDSDLFLAHRE